MTKRKIEERPVGGDSKRTCGKDGEEKRNARGTGIESERTPFLWRKVKNEFVQTTLWQKYIS